MRFRGKSIRRKIVVLLLVPLVSLTTIWAFTTVPAGREATHLFDVSSVMEEVGHPVEDTVRVLQQERRETLVHLADPRASDALAALHRSRAATDEAVSGVRENAADPGVRDAMGEHTGALNAVLDSLEGIGSLRRSVEDGTVDRSQALALYNGLIDPCHVLLADLHVVDDVGLDKQYRALVGTSRARELLAREDALLGSALVVGTLSSSEVRDISGFMAQRTLLYDIVLPQLPASERDRYEGFWKNAASVPLRVAEEAVVSSGAGPPHGITAKSWETAAGDVLDELGTLNDQAADRYQDRVRPVVVGVVARAVLVGLLGLVALLVSLLLSVRVGRGLIRDLRQLRLEAHEASGVRLPGVMRRLSAGEQVDVETELPLLEYDRNEIGEVGQALNTLQRAAVEAAVKQSELRSGISEVFVNLARRSQVLLHKQLTLLDSMERRTDDTEELADLFRLDHLTTRMRRHAEGLVILSGAAPSRRWRKPVQLMDVVRAAVAEVEDYERIEVRRLPRVALTGRAVADLTHLVAELVENATVFSPPHTAVQVLGERVANGFTLEIHDRGLGMAPETLLDANLRLTEKPDFELSDTDRLGLFVVSRLAARQKVRVSLQPSPYGGTTAIVFIPDKLLTDEVPDTNGAGFRLDRPRQVRNQRPEDHSRIAFSQVPTQVLGLPPSFLDGPVELEAPVDEDDRQGDPFGDRRSPSRAKGERPGPPQGPPRQVPSKDSGIGPDLNTQERAEAPLPRVRRGRPKLVSSHGRPVGDQHARRRRTDRDTATSSARPEQEVSPVPPTGRRGERPPPVRGPAEPPSGGEKPPPLPARRPGAQSRPGIGSRAEDRPAGAGRAPRDPVQDDGPDPPAVADVPGGRTAQPTVEADARPERPAPDLAVGPGSGSASQDPGPRSLPRRVRQASLSPQLEQSSPGRDKEGAGPVERDAEEARSRMASLQRGWRRGREENATGDGTEDGAAPRGAARND